MLLRLRLRQVFAHIDKVEDILLVRRIFDPFKQSRDSRDSRDSCCQWEFFMVQKQRR